MILTVTLNAAIDRTLAVPNFRLGRRHRAVEQGTMAGGKGVNVARALKLLGQPVIATGLAGGRTGTRLIERLAEESILNDFTRIGDESRTNTAVIDPTSGEQTEINERGPRVEETELEQFTEKLLYLAQGADICVMAGSIPREVDMDVYGRLVAELRRLDVATVVDTYGEPLRAALRAEPDVVSPNVAEAEEIVGHEFNDEEEMADGVARLVEMGARQAIMTQANGCVAMVDGDGERHRYRVAIEPLEPVAGVGSGDAFLAGYVAARYAGKASRDCLAYAVACGAESTQHFGAGTLDRKAVERLLSQVEVSEIQATAGVTGGE